MPPVIEKMRSILPAVASALAIALLAVAAHAEVPKQVAAPPKLTTTIGMQGVYYARYRAGELEAKPAQENATITLSIADATPAPAAAGQPPACIYELHYIAVRAGQYDLRDYLTRIDGQPLTDLEPIRISVREMLPADFDGNLDSVASSPLPSALPYRTIATVAAAAWGMLALWFVITRWRPRRRQAARSLERPPTLAEQLRPLVAAAIAGRLTVEGLAELERLLLGYWRERLRLDRLPTAEALAAMRRDPTAGELLRQIEIWLYEKPGRTQVNIAAILAPYENVAANPELAEMPLAETGVS